MSDTKVTQRGYGSGSGDTRAYVVEARSIWGEPEQWHGMLLDERWRRVQFVEAPIGVHVNLYDPFLESKGFLDYAAARALAHWFLSAERDWRRHGTCVEARIVEVRIKYQWSATEGGVGQTLSTIEQRRAEKFLPREVGQPIKEETGEVKP